MLAVMYVCMYRSHVRQTEQSRFRRARVQSVNIYRALAASGDTLRRSPYEIHQKAKQTAASQRSRTPWARLQNTTKSRRGWWGGGVEGRRRASKEQAARNQSGIAAVPSQRRRKQTVQISAHKARASAAEKKKKSTLR